MLEQVTSRIRWAGTEGEQQAAEEIAQTMEGYGYEVTRQSFPFTEEAVDNGSGTAMLLELARVMQDVDSDTEIRFVSFSAEEGMKGSSYYVSTLSEEEKEHLVGDIQIDMIGYYMTDAVQIKTAMGQEELAGSLTAQLGAPMVEDYGAVWGGEEMKDNLALRMYEIPKEGDAEQVIHVYGAIHNTMGNDLKAFDFAAPVETYADQGDVVDMAILETLHKVIPQDDPYVKKIISWTDGYSYILGMCTADDPKTSDSFSVRIDRYDFFDEEGNVLDTGKMLATMVHEYGHALTLNAGQLNLDEVSDSMSYNEIALYQEDSYMKAFYDAFYGGEERSYADYPEDYVDQYAGESGIFEDIAESFMVFVTSSRPKDDSLAAQKVRFFYDYPELEKIRDYIRGNFGFPQEG